MSYFGIADEVRIAEPGTERHFLAGLRAATDAVRSPGDTAAEFGSGWVVALAYEFGTALLGVDPPSERTPQSVPRSQSDAAPTALALRLGSVLAVDHDTGEVSGSLGESQQPIERSAAESKAGTASTTPQWHRTDDEYRAEVDACRAAIRDGDAYVLCLTDTAQSTTNVDPLELYLRLRADGAAVRGGVIVTGDRALVSASPERFLSVRQRRIRTHPIKGTRPRGATPQQDAALAAELLADPKERAENLMIVDLMRNDFNRVCTPASVAVERFLQVEQHPHVWQLVSTVSGELAAGLDVYDALAACFPGGSMTGAPKRSAVEILAGLEAGPRGLYSGCFGWIDDRGDAELAMTIRSVELRDLGSTLAHACIGAGGGVTADSDAARETDEKHLKAASLIAALRDAELSSAALRGGALRRATLRREAQY